MSDDGEGKLVLPSDTLALLDSFYEERDLHAKKFADLSARAEERGDGNDADEDVSMEAFAEDWNASQFWYNQQTSTTLATALLKDASPSTTIAVLSAPSAYITMRQLLAKTDQSRRPSIHLFEYDPRFAILPNFTKYDYAKPMLFPKDFIGHFDAIIVDPPFLSEDCQTKMAMTVSKVAKPEVKIIVCTGVVMQGLVEKLYGRKGVRRRPFEPQHKKGLSNQFACFANFDCEELG